MQKKQFIIGILILSALGLLTSAYLTYQHYYPSLEGSVCDITASVSCTILNSGVYSKMAGVPVAAYGIGWFIILGLLSWNSFNNENTIIKLLLWNASGFLFIFYFIYIEFVLSTLCPLCTVVHVLVAISLIFSILFYKQFYKPQLSS